MKKVLCALLGATLLSACAPIETDMEKTQAERAERRLERQATQGCGVIDEHSSYRQCVINTYARRPRTYTITYLPDGQPVAVFSQPESKAHVETEENIITQTTLAPTVSVVISETETVVPQEQIPVREKTWWETYQADRKPTDSGLVKCPCADPNVPCPQCNPK